MADDRQRGSAAIELPVVLALVLIPLGLLVLQVPTWVERQHAARSAAAEAARAAVVDPEGRLEPAQALVDRVAAGHGMAPGSLQLRWEVDDRSVTAHVTVVVPAVRLPGLGTIGAVAWTASHRERRPDLGARQP